MMTDPEYIPNEQILDRAVALWISALRDSVQMPTRPDEGNGFANIMLTILAADRNKNNHDPRVLEKFGTALKRLLATRHPQGPNSYYIRNLDVDYGPDESLSAAARAAGLQGMFPVKSRMSLNQEYVSFSVGRGPSTRHYPIGASRFYVTIPRNGTRLEETLQHLRTHDELPSWHEASFGRIE